MNDFEKIVNTNADLRRFALASRYARKRKRRSTMMLSCIGALVLVTLITVICGFFGAVHSLLAVIVSVTSLMAACFMLGLYMEMMKK